MATSMFLMAIITTSSEDVEYGWRTRWAAAEAYAESPRSPVQLETFLEIDLTATVRISPVERLWKQNPQFASTELPRDFPRVGAIWGQRDLAQAWT